MSIVSTLQTITQPNQNDAYTMNKNSPKNITLIEEDDNNGMGTTPAAYRTRIHDKLANLIEAITTTMRYNKNNNSKNLAMAQKPKPKNHHTTTRQLIKKHIQHQEPTQRTQHTT